MSVVVVGYRYLLRAVDRPVVNCCGLLETVNGCQWLSVAVEGCQVLSTAAGNCRKLMYHKTFFMEYSRKLSKMV